MHIQAEYRLSEPRFMPNHAIFFKEKVPFYEFQNSLFLLFCLTHPSCGLSSCLNL